MSLAALARTSSRVTAAQQPCPRAPSTLTYHGRGADPHDRHATRADLNALSATEYVDFIFFVFFYVIYVIMSMILLLNLLIAMMGDTFSRTMAASTVRCNGM